MDTCPTLSYMLEKLIFFKLCLPSHAQLYFTKCWNVFSYLQIAYYELWMELKED